jgi:hypothetical protein
MAASNAQDEAFDQQVTQVFWQTYFLSDEYIPGSDSEHCIVLFSRFFRSTGTQLLRKVSCVQSGMASLNTSTGTFIDQVGYR